MPKKGKSGYKSKHLQAGGTKSGSLPSSPALTAVGSPSLNQGYGASQQTLEKAKGQRTMIVHELAAAERNTGYLEAKWSGQPEGFKPTLQKVAEFNNDTCLWALKRLYWKELDVWKYDYDNPDDRQSAIDKAIKMFDRMRLGVSEPQWDKLLPREDRGKGKILSELHAKIANGPQAPKIKVQKADDAGSEAGGDDVLKIEGGEAMARTGSQPGSTKKKSAISKLTSKKSKPSTPKTTQTKMTKDKSGTGSGAGAGAKGTRAPLSAEFISDSDSDSSESRPMAATAASKVKKASPVPPSSKTQEKCAASPATKQKPKAKSAEEPAEQEPVKRPKPQQPTKRPREEGDGDSESSSSSGRPLAKRIKPKAPALEKASLKAPVSLKQRPAAQASAPDSQASRGNSSNGNLSFKSTKNTSPAKSSPLATSPPTNASNLEQRRHRPSPEPVVSRKRKIPADVSDDASSKGSTTSVDSGSIKRHKRPDPKLMRKAETFMRHYKKYKSLHHAIADMDRPPRQDMERLRRMRDQLADMKAEIYEECPPAIAVA